MLLNASSLYGLFNIWVGIVRNFCKNSQRTTLAFSSLLAQSPLSTFDFWVNGVNVHQAMAELFLITPYQASQPFASARARKRKATLCSSARLRPDDTANQRTADARAVSRAINLQPVSAHPQCNFLPPSSAFGTVRWWRALSRACAQLNTVLVHARFLCRCVTNYNFCFS